MLSQFEYLALVKRWGGQVGPSYLTLQEALSMP